MTKTDQEKEDQVLRRMLLTPPRPHKPAGGGEPKPAADRSLKKQSDQAH